MEQRQKPVRFMGLYRTGMTEEKAAFYARIMKMLHRHGTLGEGELANRVLETLASESWNEAMRELVGFNAVELVPATYARSKAVRLTGEGQVWGLEFQCKGQEQQPHHIRGSQAEAWAAKCAAERK